jgi:nucleoside-diphosphate-sugar epimerase
VSDPLLPVDEARPLLVTGATGFVGRHVLTRLAAQDEEPDVLALVRDPAQWHGYDWTRDLGNVELVRGAVAHTPSWSGELPALGGILHLAAVVRHSRRDLGDLYETNVEGTLHMVRLAAAHRCRLVMVSTSGTVGCFESPHERADEDAAYVEETVGRWPYYRSKIEAERRARALAQELDVELVFLRPPVLLGPGDHRLRSTSNVWKAIRRKLPFVVRGGIHFADVRDAAGAVVAALSHPAPRPVYHVEGTECSIEEFFGMVEEVSGVPGPRWLLPYRPAWLLARALERLHLLPDPVVVEMASRYWGARSLHAGADLGYKARDPRETLRDTVSWLRDHAPTA